MDSHRTEKVAPFPQPAAEETASALKIPKSDLDRIHAATAAAVQGRLRALARWAVGLGALLALVAVMAGAFGAHALRDRVPADLLPVFETGARYQMYHALALIGLGLAASAHLIGPRTALAAMVLFLAGTVIFSGTLYILTLTEVRRWGAVTPIGGMLQISGWITLVVGVWLSGRPRRAT